MSIFLLEYDPGTQRVIGPLCTYSSEDREEAQKERLRREKQNAALRRRREVVLLEAMDEAALRTTHGRYFKTIQELTAGGGIAAD